MPETLAGLVHGQVHHGACRKIDRCDVDHPGNILRYAAELQAALLRPNGANVYCVSVLFRLDILWDRCIESKMG